MRWSSLISLLLFGFAAETSSDPWLILQEKSYTYHYQEADKGNTQPYLTLLNTGIVSTTHFFNQAFPKSFEVFVHPTRESWDKKFREAYQLPDFKSECWMVASGDGFQLNMISPITWDTAACEHNYGDQRATQELITHELIHVFHGQHNASPDFMELTGLDWLAEGLATYASGQLTGSRLTAVKQAVAQGQAPTALDDFWKGQHRYGLSGSMVKYIDERYGRATLTRLLAYKSKPEVLTHLGISETELLEGWRKSAGTW